jgi:Tol biopolymer transport system component
LADGTVALVRGGHVVIVDQQGAPIREMPNVSVVSDDNGGFLPSPDGSHLAFKTSSRDIRLKVANARSGEVVTLPDGVDNLTAAVGWSPDSKFLAYVASFPYGLVVVGADGQNPRRLVSVENLPVSLRGQLGRPSWSPDGKVIFIGLRSGNTPDDTSVVAVNVDGSGWAQVLMSFMPVAISPDGLELFAIKVGGGNLWLAEVRPQ